MLSRLAFIRGVVVGGGWTFRTNGDYTNRTGDNTFSATENDKYKNRVSITNEPNLYTRAVAIPLLYHVFKKKKSLSRH